MADHLSLTFRPAFPSSAIVSERSSPSRVRYAAPNNGAPLTAPVRSEQTLPLRGKELVLVSGPPRRHFGPFSDCHRHDIQNHSLSGSLETLSDWGLHAGFE